MESQLGSFVSDFLGGKGAHHAPKQSAGTIAVATGDSRLIVGNIINNNYASDISADSKLEQSWLKVQQWLAPSQQALDTQAMLDRDSRASQFEGTCAWYIGSNTFKDWLSGSRRLEWVHSGVGRGKTVLCSAAVEQTSQHCHGHEATKVCYFYCTTRDPSGKDATVLLRFLLAQLLQPLTPSRPIMRLYDECHAVYPPKVPTTRDLIDTMFEIVQNRDNERAHIYIMIDGLDEIPFETSDRQEALGFLSDLAGLELDHVSLFVTSRDQSDIQEALKEPVAWSQTTMESSKIQQDIDSYVFQNMQSNRRLKRLSSHVREAIQVEISNKADGMFLWTALQISYLANLRPLTDKIAFDAVRSLPSNLNETYYRILQGIHDEFTAVASRALAWLAFSSRTLFVEELIDACAIDLDLAPEPVLGTRLEPYQLFEMLNDLILIQPALESLDEPPRHGMHTVSLCHASVGEFLQSIGSASARGPGYSPRMDGFLIEREAANLLIARACLAYLFYYNTPDAKSREFPLLGYSWYRWERHVGVDIKNEYQSDDNSIIRAKASDIYSRLDSSVISGSAVMDHGSISLCLNWLRRGEEETLLDALNVPYFYPNFESFFGFDHDCDLSQTVYRAMDGEGSSTRVLELLPCLDISTTIRCRLIVVNLDEQPKYIAVSYVWGPMDEMEQAMIHGVPRRLLPTQAQILRLLRSRKDGAISKIWLDGLCINQDEMEEKAAQIALMGRVFSQAQEVIVSLGRKPPDAAQGLAVLDKMAAIIRMKGQDEARLRRQALDTLDTLEEGRNAIALDCLFQDRWWTRAWTIQEVVLASDVNMVMGDLSFNSNAIELAVAAESILKRHLRHAERTRWRRMTGLPGWEAAKAVLKVRSEHRSHGPLPIHPLFWRFRHSQTVDARHRLYALQSMCSQSDSHSVPVDYTMDVAQLSLLFTRLAIEKYGTLDALSIASILHSRTVSPFSDSTSKLPSWAIDLRKPHPRDKTLVLGVFEWPQAPSPYAAMGPVTALEQERPSVEGETLRVCGYISGCVRRVKGLRSTWDNKRLYGDLDAHDHVPHTWNTVLRRLCDRISGWTRPDTLYQRPRHNADSPTRARWRTMLADQWPMGQRLAGGSFMDMPVPNTEEEEASLLLNIEIQDEDMPFLRGRAFILTDAHGLGLAPEDTQVGDLIAFLFGGSVPYILRAHEDHYRLIGECYLYGYMDGEILQEKRGMKIINII